VTAWEMAHFDEIAALGDRHEALSKLQPKCPTCGHEQVQLLEYTDIAPARWKCRVCKTRFERDL
jgi:transposase-like protein